MNDYYISDTRIENFFQKIFEYQKECAKNISKLSFMTRRRVRQVIVKYETIFGSLAYFQGNNTSKKISEIDYKHTLISTQTKILKKFMVLGDIDWFLIEKYLLDPESLLKNNLLEKFNDLNMFDFIGNFHNLNSYGIKYKTLERIKIKDLYVLEQQNGTTKIKLKKIITTDSKKRETSIIEYVSQLFSSKRLERIISNRGYGKHKIPYHTGHAFGMSLKMARVLKIKGISSYIQGIQNSVSASIKLLIQDIRDTPNLLSYFYRKQDHMLLNKIINLFDETIEEIRNIKLLSVVIQADDPCCTKYILEKTPQLLMVVINHFFKYKKFDSIKALLTSHDLLLLLLDQAEHAPIKVILSGSKEGLNIVLNASQNYLCSEIYSAINNEELISIKRVIDLLNKFDRLLLAYQGKLMKFEKEQLKTKHMKLIYSTIYFSIENDNYDLLLEILTKFPQAVKLAIMSLNRKGKFNIIAEILGKFPECKSFVNVLLGSDQFIDNEVYERNDVQVAKNMLDSGNTENQISTSLLSQFKEAYNKEINSVYFSNPRLKDSSSLKEIIRHALKDTALFGGRTRSFYILQRLKALDEHGELTDKAKKAFQTK